MVFDQQDRATLRADEGSAKMAAPCCRLWPWLRWRPSGGLLVRAGAQAPPTRRLVHGDGRNVPRRAVLYVPGDDERKLRKLPTLGADCAVMDCEDGVAQNRKEVARDTVVRMLSELSLGRTEPSVRVNAVASGLAEDDLRALLGGPVLPPTILLPKVDSVDDIRWFAERFEKGVAERELPAPINLITFVESAVGLLDLREICCAAISVGERVGLTLAGIVFGSDDFCASIGATRTSDARELLYARQHVVVVARALGLQSIDMVHIDFRDPEGLARHARDGALMGFTGKQVIHPSQVSVVQREFSPSAARLQWASELVHAFSQHQQQGKGAFTFQGSMIDMPLLRQARNILAMAASTSRS
ncbi:citramalyl-CoA lyase, mitochondrial [Petromyzon marinus]|uniref:Citramalyl-CoA lyase, mitochondrial n=1 Tax=Petromyzon marinus TaxID=7757 RepID=A0AAJ7UE85_PETMA|nr:citramalyl-CoA lyase, mitochondrial [Petromyzon marinus]